jgi:hypothetical protein
MAKWQKGDTEIMTTVQKGEILYLDSVGKKPKEIAGKTGRSMEWIKNIIGALAGTKTREKLIDEYEKAVKKGKK